ncbi:MAG: sulfotransferase domain-containing protein [Acidimicrobiia bacterium]|nr:sulfotransferase domain-containing protein [Acidimicrobiia bacterium]
MPTRTGPWPPDFLILGAEKCATTSLASALRAHPQVFIPRRKEAHHFGSVDDAEVSGDSYRRFFAGWDGQPVVGEATPHYLSWDRSAEQICRFLPEVKGIVLLRDPVDRAYSAFWHGRRAGELNDGFTRAIDRELVDGRSSSQWFHDLVARGRYAEQVGRYLDLGFDRERLLVVFYEEMVADEAAALSTVQEMLGVAPIVTSLPRQNRARTSWLPRRVRTLVSSRSLSMWARVVERVTGRAFTPPPMDPSDRARLNEYYRPHNERLAELLGRDLPGWGR